MIENKKNSSHFRLLQHISKCENGSITLPAIQEKYPDKSVSGHAIGRTIKKIFKGTLIKSVRTKNKSVLTKMYYGLKWKSLTNSNCSLLDIKTISGSDLFVMFESETKLQLGYFNGFAVNGHKILTEVSFHEDKHVGILVCNKEINLTDIQLSSTFLFDSKVISGILDGIRNLNLCKGVANSDMSNTEDTLIEQWSDKNGETSTKIRSTKCKRILTYTTTKSVCDECAPLLSKKFENTSKLHGEKLDTHIQLSDISHKDMTDVLDHVLKTVPDKIATFLKSQLQTIESHPNGRRWPRDVTRMCLSLYCRSPKTYHDLSRSGFVVLPSQRVLQRYKNCVQQQPGINPEMLEWMKSIAVEQNVSKDGYNGGLMIDEIAIQEDLQLKRTGEKIMNWSVSLI